jgi:hypothetical protein
MGGATAAEEHGFRLDLRPETPVVVDEHHLDRGLASGIWGEIDGLTRRWGDVGAAWVNLRFGLDDHGRAIIQVEANHSGEALPDGGIPACNGGFDRDRLLSGADFERYHPRGGPVGIGNPDSVTRRRRGTRGSARRGDPVGERRAD